MTVGYDHAVSRAVHVVKDLLRYNIVGEIQSLNVNFLEHWKGIFAAHPWLKGPEDSYLGYWRRGGGAGCEHSHALHLWLYFARLLEWGPVVDVASEMDMHVDGEVEFDRCAQFRIKTESGKSGMVTQDVITEPTQKIVKFQSKDGFIEWNINGCPDGDLVSWTVDGNVEKMTIHKKRPDDFHLEMLHYEQLLQGTIAPHESPLSLSLGAEVMEILCEAYSLATIDGEEEKE